MSEIETMCKLYYDALARDNLFLAEIYYAIILRLAEEVVGLKPERIK